MNDFQKRIEEAFQQAQTRASVRAKELEGEARKVLETLSDRVQAEMKTLLQQAQATSREQMVILGAELEKLGKKLQHLGQTVRPPEAAHAADEKATQQPPGEVQ